MSTATTVPPTATHEPTKTAPPPTVTPTEAPRGNVVFFDDFNGGVREGWDPNIDNVDGLLNRHGTQIDFVPDPTNPDKRVMRITISGPPVENLYPDAKYWYTAYPRWVTRDGVTVTAIEVKLFVPKDNWHFVPGSAISVLSAHGKNGGREVVAFGVSESGRIKTLTRDVDGNEIRTKSEMRVAVGGWTTLRIEFSDGETRFLANGKEIRTAAFAFQAADAHAGFQRSFANLDENVFTEGDSILNKDFVVEGR